MLEYLILPKNQKEDKNRPLRVISVWSELLGMY